ncbi:hypothetical protein ACFL6U_26405 [Planctomycetota bacterium]
MTARSDISVSKLKIFVILLILALSQTAQSQQWERVLGQRDPGVIITSEHASYWSSPRITSIEGAGHSLTTTNIWRDIHGRTIQHLTGVRNANDVLLVESLVSNAVYEKEGRVTAFEEIRYYPPSGRSYRIVVSNVQYSGHNVSNIYNVTVDTISSGGGAPWPNKAVEPFPEDGAVDQEKTVQLSWSNGGKATSYDVYFGTSSYIYWAHFRDNLIGTIYEPGVLLRTITYYWRVDAINEYGIIKGDTWSFTTTEDPKAVKIYVDVDAAGKNDGTSWENAFLCLSDALIFARDEDTIHVAEGVYKPPDQNAILGPPGIEIVSSEDSLTSFDIVYDLTLEGGYAGFGESEPNSRDLANHETILTCDSVSETNINNDSPGLISFFDRSNSTVLDGLQLLADIYSIPACLLLVIPAIQSYQIAHLEITI